MKLISKAFLCVSTSLLLANIPAQAAQITSFSPQGEISTVRQVVARFDEPMVPMGDPNATAPLTLSCEPEGILQGQGRWVDEKIWAYDFSKDLPPGAKCTATITTDLKSVAGNAYSGPQTYNFNTGGPFVVSIRPWGHYIAEDQVFVLQLNGDATAASIQEHIWCESSAVGERLPINVLQGDERNSLLSHFGWSEAAQQNPNTYWVLQCQQRLASNASVSLFYGQGVETPTGIANNDQKVFHFSVRDGFKASFSCTRENAQAACLPLEPMRLQFNAPLPVQTAALIELKSRDGEIYRPVIDEKTQAEGTLHAIAFPAPLPEETAFEIILPADVKDDTGRELVNADSFPLSVATAPMPALAKFAAAPFGIIELYATPDEPPLVPLTVRRVENTLDVRGMTLPANRGSVSNIRLTSDPEIIRWLHAIKRFNYSSIEYHDALALMPQAYIPEHRKPVHTQQGYRSTYVPTREISLLRQMDGTQKIELPAADEQDLRPFEVIGIPVMQPGYHVLEVASPSLAQALINPEYNGSMYVRTGVLVTNLGVHAKIGRENSLVWVTSLNDGTPVVNADVRISGCDGTEYFSGKTNEQGILQVNEQLSENSCPDNWDRFLFISARVADEKAPGGMDMAFTLTSWDRGIEYWRFGFPTNFSPITSSIASTVFDRTLLRAGETVSMKHFIRSLNLAGFSVPENVQIDAVQIIHQGSGQETVIPVEWNTSEGGLSAQTTFNIPTTAKLGTYQVYLINKDNGRSYHYHDDETSNYYYTGSFQVEEFRLPVFEGNIAITYPDNNSALVQPREIPLGLQVNYLSGGGASQLPVKISAVVRDTSTTFPAYNNRFSFAPPTPVDNAVTTIDESEDDYDYYDENVTSTQPLTSSQTLIADKLPLTLDRNGAGQITLQQIPAVRQPLGLLIEASFADPNGEIVTIRRSETLWPASVVAGIRNDSWVSIQNSKIALQAIALNTRGTPATGVPMEIRAQERITTSTRRRLVGGFYAYDSSTEVKDLGSICSGTTDEHGLLTCEHTFTTGGNIELIAVARDDAGRSSSASTSLWVTSRNELWFGGSDNDRIDLLPEQTDYRPGDTARFQLRMPFRHATALVTVEREGIIESHVMELSGNNPTIELQVKDYWGPNVYISALVLRGRLHEIPLYSFFNTGYTQTEEWWQSFESNMDYTPPTAMIDLSKPAYRLGVAEIRVTDPAYQLNVNVTTDKPAYQVRSTAQASITVQLPDGTPASHADVAIAVVDEALLELKKNNSWNLLESMLARRSWGVRTSTAQMEIVGRRHYGRKALPAGGGGGGSSTRELFDTLLLWNGRVQLDEQGQATVEIPLNDSLTTFRIAVIAAEGASRFGTGTAKFQTTQDLQLISGLPPVVRSDDQYRAAVTVRNATQTPMTVEVHAQATGLELESQTLDIPANAAREAVWHVTVPAEIAGMHQGTMTWEISAKNIAADSSSDTQGAADAIKISQRVLTGVPITVRQATLKQLDGTLELPVAPPSDGLPGRGGIQVSMVPRLAEGLPAIVEWFGRYPYICLEQQVSISLGTRDASRWASLINRIPDYLDEDGLAYYYPPSSGVSRRGSDVLTAYILSAANEASKLHPELALPSNVSDTMLSGLEKFAEGKLQRSYWAPRRDLDQRRLLAMEALSRYGRFHPRMLSSISITPNQWPTTSVINWLQILQRTPSMPEREERLEQAQQILRSRLNVAGTRMGFSTDADDYWWWMMWNSDLNAAYLLLATLDEPTWQEDLPKLVTGFIARQQNGSWHTTTSNLWGSFALEAFSRKFESEPIAGFTRARMVNASGVSIGEGHINWEEVQRVPGDNTIGSNAPGAHRAFGAPSAAASFENNAVFLAWPTPPEQTTVILNQDGTGRPWATIQSLAAVPLKAPFSAGYSVTKTITPVDEQVRGQVTRGDIWRVHIEINAQTDMTWVVLNDPIPGGATILGSGLGRDSEIALNTPTGSNQGNTGHAWLAYQERAQDAFRAYYEYVPKGTITIEYTVRLNNEGTFILPPTRVEAMYAPEMFGEIPNESVTIQAAPAN